MCERDGGGWLVVVVHTSKEKKSELLPYLPSTMHTLCSLFVSSYILSAREREREKEGKREVWKRKQALGKVCVNRAEIPLFFSSHSLTQQ